MWPTTEPVALVVHEPFPDGMGLWIETEPQTHRFLGWRPGSEILDVMPGLPGVYTEGRPVLCPGGHAVLVELARGRFDEQQRGVGVVDRGVARVDLRTGEVARVDLEPLPRYGVVPTSVAGSPDGAVLALLGSRARTPADAAARPATPEVVELCLAPLDGTPPRRLAAFDGRSLAEWNPDDVGVQWSPDGTRIACSTSWDEGPVRGPVRMRRETVVYDATTGAEVQRVPGSLCGSASWSADSTHLLVDAGLDDTWIHDLTRDTARPVTVLPPSGARDMRPVRALGLADEDHLVTARHRGERMTIALTAVADGTTTGILTWTELEARYPRIAAVPRSTWLATAATHPIES